MKKSKKAKQKTEQSSGGLGKKSLQRLDAAKKPLRKKSMQKKLKQKKNQALPGKEDFVSDMRSYQGLVGDLKKSIAEEERMYSKYLADVEHEEEEMKKGDSGLVRIGQTPAGNDSARKKESGLSINKTMSLREDLLIGAEQAATRDGFGDALVELGEKNPDVVALCADLNESTRTEAFRKKFPQRFFGVGIAEQNMLAITAGLALYGKIPFASSFGIFAVGRAWDQLRTSICYAKANAKVAATHCGVSVGYDGATHEMLNDIALTRTIPNLTVLSPCDYEQAKKAVFAAAEIIGPVYIRLSRMATAKITTPDTPFVVGKADFYAEGTDAMIIATGEMVGEALAAAKKLSDEGIHTGVLNVHTIKPLDTDAIKVAMKTRLIVTAEDHSIIGGLGSAVAEVISQIDQDERTKQAFVGVGDVFGRSGEPHELMKRFKITSDDICEAVRKEFPKK